MSAKKRQQKTRPGTSRTPFNHRLPSKLVAEWIAFSGTEELKKQAAVEAALRAFMVLPDHWRQSYLAGKKGAADGLRKLNEWADECHVQPDAALVAALVMIRASPLELIHAAMRGDDDLVSRWLWLTELASVVGDGDNVAEEAKKILRDARVGRPDRRPGMPSLIEKGKGSGKSARGK